MSELRDATEADAAAIAAVYAPYCQATPISFEVEAPSAEQVCGRIAKVLPLYPWLVCELEGRVVGYAYASRHRERAAYRWGVDVAVYLDGACHRRGIGRALYSALLPMLALSLIVLAAIDRLLLPLWPRAQYWLDRRRPV